MYVRPISTRLLRGMLTPEIRAKVFLPLTLLVTRVLADHQHAAVPADDLALLTHRLDRRSYLHGPFRCLVSPGGSGGPCGRRYHPVTHAEPSRPQNATSEYSAHRRTPDPAAPRLRRAASTSRTELLSP